MRINLEVEEAWNEQRKQLSVTWRAVLKAGLAALQQQPVESEIPSAIEAHLKKGLDGLSAAWKLIKPLIKNNQDSKENKKG